MDRSTFVRFRNLIYQQSGITIGEKKESLLVSRIGRRMRILGLTDFKAYYQKVAEDPEGAEMVALIDAVSTNVTHFFRESQHFEFLSLQIDEWLKKGKRKFRVWCAASSSGEEPYSIAMIMHDKCSSYQVDYRILATDICTEMLARAETAEYRIDNPESIPLKYRNRYLEPVGRGRTNAYRVNAELRNRVTFARLNLARPPFPMSGPFDAVFIRNVMIYFDNAVRSALLAEAHRLLRPGGFLFVGHSEGLAGMLNSDLKRVLPSVYLKD